MERTTTITPEGLEQTQAAWIRYRDAWVEFGRVHYSTVTAESWKAWLTRERIRMLEYLLVYEMP